MIVDTSVIFAVVLKEAEAGMFAEIVGKNPGARLSAGSWIELAAVMSRRFQNRHDASIDTLMQEWRLDIAAVTATQARIARQAYRTYGIGTGHPARLNFGDCFSYALAIETGEPLLFKGDDLGRTDVRRAIG